MATQPEKRVNWNRASIEALIDSDRGRLDRRIYEDEAIYQLELERIFARSWNFMCHESQIPEPGDYFINFIGEDQVIVARDRKGKINVMLNTCRHRGNALCRAEQGNAKSFVCSYHGWNYDLDGRLIAVPGRDIYYRDKFDRTQWGLAHAAQVENYLGFIFATLDKDAPPLSEYLGDVGRTGLGMIAAYGDVEVIEGIQKNVIDCNWKIAVDNLFDWYHVMYSHASAGATGVVDLPAILHPKNQLVMLGDYGHAISGPGVPSHLQAEADALSDEERAAYKGPALVNMAALRPREAVALMGPEGIRSAGHPNIFPNAWVTLNGLQICLRLPRGPNKTELWWFTFVPKAFPPEYRAALVSQAIHLFGPSGLLEQDDGENWSQSTRASRGVASRKLDHVLEMGLGQDEVKVHESGQRVIDTTVNEHGQRWFYRAWSEWLAAESWQELEASRTAPPEGVI